MDERRARVEAICEAALERDPHERAAFVAEACGADSDLRRDVEALLTHAQAAEGFLSRPVVSLAAQMFASGEQDAADPGGSPLIGRRFGVYEILALLGAGGMGEVYRARDTTLGRDVAIKILPRHFTWNPDRLARFEREARVLATLNHPHIGAIYGTIETDAGRGIVLELVDGPTLADRLAAERMPVDEALQTARQIAEALEAAHEKGVIHRDLKPANIKIASNGLVKVIDFGLAKARGDDGSDPGTSPVLSPSMTRSGVIIGSPAYMSPEQARGLPVDKRADIWAYGCVLFEMLAGINPFHSDSASGAMAKVIEREPDWAALPADLPPPVVRLLKRCLNKKAVNRLHDIADARLELVDLLSGHETIAAGPRAKLGPLPWVGVSVGLIAAAVAGFFIARTLQPRQAIDDRVQRVAVLPPPDARVASEFVALSPDGRFLAFAASSADGRSRLWVRPLDGAAAKPLAGTDDARFPFWSPDSRYIAFFAQHQLKKILPDGGPAQVICDAPYGFGGTWSRDGVIVFAPDAATFLHRVAADGGTPAPASALDLSQEQFSHSSPAFLPDGKHFFYTVTHRPPKRNTIEIAALGEPRGRRVVDADSAVRFAKSGDEADFGYLLFVRQGTLMAQRFDLRRYEVTADPVILADATIPVMTIGAGAPFSISDTGMLAYRDTRLESRLTWLDRSGRTLATLATPERYNGVELSPDGKHVAVERVAPRDGTTDIWLADSDTGSLTQFTFTGGSHPKWSADGTFVAFNHERSILRKRVDGSGEEEVLRESDASMMGPIGDWAPDGSVFVMRRIPSQTGAATGKLFLIKPRPAVNATEVPQAQFNGRFSPDGKWLAYTADQNGSEEVYVQPLPMTGAQWLVSRGGGVRPHWRRDGRELFYIASSAVNGAGRLMAAPIMPGPSFRVGTPVPLFDVSFVPGDANDYSYSASADGQRFLVIQPTEDATRAPFTLVMNWMAMLRR